MGTNCYGQEIVLIIPNELMLFLNEIQIYQAIHLLINSLGGMEIN